MTRDMSWLEAIETGSQRCTRAAARRCVALGTRVNEECRSISKLSVSITPRNVWIVLSTDMKSRETSLPITAYCCVRLEACGDPSESVGVVVIQEQLDPVGLRLNWVDESRQGNWF